MLLLEQRTKRAIVSVIPQKCLFFGKRLFWVQAWSDCRLLLTVQMGKPRINLTRDIFSRESLLQGRSV